MERGSGLETLYEDDWIVVVDKPSGLMSVGFPGFRGKTAQEILADRYRSRGKVRIFAVHRLDRDTSGVMLFAKSAEARSRFMDDWQETVSERVYRCVCAREPRAEALPDSGTIDEPIAYNVKDVGFVPRKDDEPARAKAERAVTRFRVLERGAAFDLVECELETGRKNQIRVHLSHLGHPIVGDEAYGKRFAGGSDRLALHARAIAFTHPFTGDVKRFEVPEPKAFARLVRESRSKPTAEERGAGPAGRGGERNPGGAKARGSGSAERREKSDGKERRGGDEGFARADAGKSGRSGRFSNGSKFIPGK